MPAEKRRIIQVLGPTGVGKSAVALQLARRFTGEIISADSVQVYRDFDVGSDKVGSDARKEISHHLIDIYSNCGQFNAAVFLELSFIASELICNRGHLPITCGGTALYLRTMITGIFAERRADPGLREDLSRRADDEGLESLWLELRGFDPNYAEKVNRNDRVRIIRGLEIYHNNGVAPSEMFKKSETPFKNYRFTRIGLNINRDVLYERINRRVDTMVARGFVEEVKRLREIYPPDCPPLKAIGYREICRFLNGEIDLERAVDLVKQYSRNFAKRQLSWFRRESDIYWFDPEDERAIIEKIEREL